MMVEDNGFYVVMCQDICICQICWVCVDNCYFFIGLFYIRYIWMLVYFECFIVDIVFNVVDGYCVKFIVQSVGIFVQMVLWVDLFVNFWQGVGLV